MGGFGAALGGAAGQIGQNMQQDYVKEHDEAMKNLSGFMDFLKSQAQNESLHPSIRSIWGGWYGQLASAPVTGRLKIAEQIHKDSEKLGQTILVGHKLITDSNQAPANLPPGAPPNAPAMQSPPQTLYGAPSVATAAYSTGAVEEAKRKGDIAAAEAWSDYFTKRGVTEEDVPFHVEAMLGRPMPSGYFF